MKTISDLKRFLLPVTRIFLVALASFTLFACASTAPSSSEASATNYAPSEASSEMDPSAELQRREAAERMVAYTASLRLDVKNTDETKKALIELVKSNDGYIVQETESYVRARIPVANLDAFIASSKTLGKTKNESKTGTDITDQYIDNVLRLESYKSVRDRYLALLEKAVSLADILSIEKELHRVNLEIEKLEGKIKNAEASVAYSSITVNFGEKAKPGPLGWVFYGLFQGIKWLFVWN